jgi:hypothetical protein
MDDDRSRLCKAISAWFTKLRAEIYQDARQDDRAWLKAMADAYCKAILARTQAGALTAEEWSELALEIDLVQSVRGKGRALHRYLSALHFEWADFANQLATRQGTHIPDWKAFYAARNEMEERIRRRNDP